MDAKWTRRLASRPLVALDWNFIRSMRDTASALPNSFNYLVPEMALVEAVTSDSASPVKLTKNLLRFLKLNQCRTFLASHIGHFIPAEDSPGKLAPPGFIAHAPFFATEAEAFDVDVGTLESRVREMKGRDHQYVGIQREFEQGRAHFADLMRQGALPHGKLEHNHPDDFDRVVIEPKIAAGWATIFGDKYEDLEWQTALAVFPDQHAVGRWWRIALWYWLRAARGVGPKRLRNDWADSIYVFTASYADQFWTGDDDAARLVRLLFKNTKVEYRTPSEVGERP